MLLIYHCCIIVLTIKNIYILFSHFILCPAGQYCLLSSEFKVFIYLLRCAVCQSTGRLLSLV